MPQFNSMEDVKKHLEGLTTLSQLRPEDYAPEDGGMANTIAIRSKEDMKFTQIRKFFGHIKKIEATEIKGKKDMDKVESSKLYLLMPELAYGVGRKVVNREFYEVMKICLSKNKIKTVADFRRFIELLTAVIAYHKLSERRG